ncbi:hypothetical protein A2U01_0108970, partial [Trifolium medium]|nr:hypothetical protein [Trifolium medium]
MGDERQPPRRTMGNYCKRYDAEQISLGFKPVNPVVAVIFGYQTI